MPDTSVFFDCFSGASGDMVLGALVDAGVPIDALARDVASLPCGPVRLRAEKVVRGGISATRVHVEAPHEHAHRGLGDIKGIINAAPLGESVKANAIRIFTRLGEAEAAVHGCPVEHIHFHEVGALDAIADIVGAAAGLEHLGASEVRFSTLRLGGGTVKAAHGLLPVPAPATARLIAGCACEMGPVQTELLTPTAAAILTTLGRQDAAPRIRYDAIGYGAGTKEFPGHANLLRLFVGPAVARTETDSVWVLECNLDDMTAEVCGHAIERLLAARALDAWAAPVQMKKSRPAWMLCAIAEDATLAAVEEVFFRETTTFGVRRTRAERSKLSREHRTVQTPYGPVRVKVGALAGRVITASPEFEDCRSLAREKDVPLRDVMAAATAAFNAGKPPA
jgi:uncharacterized protein (TIGR00299 family) protein